jgi:4-diphosphocytidyl-2-C-methyl-D-erythritol kinase
VLRLLDRILGGVSPERLLAVAEGLGADVPFFLAGVPAAVGTGRGDRIHPLVAPPAVRVVLILPPFGTETAKVFAHSTFRVRPAPSDGLAAATRALAAGIPRDLRAAHYNALAGPAFRAVPELLRFTSQVERRLGRSPAMSGSGSTLFDIPDPGEDVLARLDGLPGRRIELIAR